MHLNSVRKAKQPRQNWNHTQNDLRQVRQHLASLPCAKPIEWHASHRAMRQDAPNLSTPFINILHNQRLRVHKDYISRKQQATTDLPASSRPRDGPCATAPRLPPARPKPRRDLPVSESPAAADPIEPRGGGARSGDGVGWASGLGDLGCALRSFQIPLAPRTFGPSPRLLCCYLFFFFSRCVGVESDRFEFLPAVALSRSVAGAWW
jgi:hypothetical protein